MGRDCPGRNSIPRTAFVRQLGRHQSSRKLVSILEIGGLDVASIMFCMHYAPENEENVRMMLENTAGAFEEGVN